MVLKSRARKLPLALAATSALLAACGGPDVDQVEIPKGCFQMGAPEGEILSDPREQPAHKVCLEKFLLDRTEVTVQEYQKAVPSYVSAAADCPTCPATGISWSEAKAYCESKKRRLPTEAEFEYAQRAGTTSRYYWGDQIRNDKAWYWWNTSQKLQPVQGNEPNPWGLYDMAGNAWEWVSDWSSPYTTAEAVNPKGPEDGLEKIVRGGAYDSQENQIRSAFRSWFTPNNRNPTIGFRCAE